MAFSNGPHVIECLQENLDVLKDAFGAVKPADVPLFNLSSALMGMYEDLEAEFQRLNTRLTNIEQQLRR